MKNIGSAVYVNIPAQTIPPLTETEIGSNILTSGFWIIHVSIWATTSVRQLTLNFFSVVNGDQKPELIAFYNGPGAELPLTVYSWENNDIEIGPTTISAFKLC